MKKISKKMKKIKASKNKIRSRTSQKSNNLKTLDLNSNNQSKIKDSNKNINNESNKSLVKIRAKTEGKNNSRILNSEKKSVKNKNNISIKVENNKLNNTLKLNKTHSSKFTLSEQSYNKTKKKLNLDNNNNNGENNNSKIKERKNSKDTKNMVKKNSSKTKINTVQKSQNNLKSKSNLLTDSKEKLNEEKIISKKLLSNKNNTPKIDYRKSFDYSNKKSSKQKSNNYVKKNTEIYSAKKSSSKKNLLNNPKNKNNKNNNIKTKTEEDTDTIIKSFEKQKEFLEKMRKQREENNLREEAKKKELEKEKEEERQREEERKKREMEIKKREEQRKKELEEEERKKEEERKQKQMEIEAKIQQEKIEKENIKKELEKQKQLEKQKKLEEEERIRKEKEKEEEERIKKEEMEKLEIEMDKMIEEEIKELPNNIELKIDNNDNNYLEENKNKEMNIQDLLELEEKNDQNFEYFHIKEEEETKKEKPEIISEEQKDEKEENKNININTNDNNDKNNNNNTPVAQYRKISILELIHDVKNFSPILFEFLSLKDLLEFTSISKKIKRQRIYIFNLQKKINLNNIGFEDMQSLNNKIKEYEENYSNNELNEPYIEFHLSRGAARAVQLLNNNTYSKIFRRPVLDNNLSQIYIAYKILLVFLGEINVAKISDDKLFWVKCTEYLNTNSENGKIGDYIMNKFEKYNCDCKTVFYIEKLMKGKKENISPSYYSKICGSTGLLIFLIKELLEYCGVIISTKKTQLSRIYQNLIFFKNIIDKLSEFNKTLESFNQ